MNHLAGIRSIGRNRVVRLWVVLLMGIIACGDGESSPSGPTVQTADEILAVALRGIGRFTAVRIDTSAIASAARAGDTVRVPFAEMDGSLVTRDLTLRLRNLRAPELTAFVLKDGVRNQGQAIPLPPPATYQGTVAAAGSGPRGAAILTITDQVVEGNLLIFPGGWSLIEPIEPLLRVRGVDPAQRAVVLSEYNHIVYNAAPSSLAAQTRDRSSSTDAVPAPPSRAAAAGDGQTAPPVLSIVGDGDAELYRAYPPDSVMPFWRKQEGLFNAVDWLYNCIEPEQNAFNDYIECGNDFDGGSDAFQVQVRIDRFESWTDGGPSSRDRNVLLEESARMTHQALPLCCGEPHTGGESDLVHFFTGKHLKNGEGLAAIGGLDVYGDACFARGPAFCCHHALSSMLPNSFFPARLFEQQMLVAHEIGHNNGSGEEPPRPEKQPWLFGNQRGDGLMYSSFGFGPGHIFVYGPLASQELLGPLLDQRLGAGPVSGACSATVLPDGIS